MGTINLPHSPIAQIRSQVAQESLELTTSPQRKQGLHTQAVCFSNNGYRNLESLRKTCDVIDGNFRQFVLEK